MSEKIAAGAVMNLMKRDIFLLSFNSFYHFCSSFLFLCFLFCLICCLLKLCKCSCKLWKLSVHVWHKSKLDSHYVFFCHYAHSKNIAKEDKNKNGNCFLCSKLLIHICCGMHNVLKCECDCREKLCWLSVLVISIYQMAQQCFFFFYL